MCKCENCDLEIKTGLKYCSIQCQQDKQRMEKVNLWLEGKNDGMKGKTSTAKWIKWYLIKINGEILEPRRDLIESLAKLNLHPIKISCWIVDVLEKLGATV